MALALSPIQELTHHVPCRPALPAPQTVHASNHNIDTAIVALSPDVRVRPDYADSISSPTPPLATTTDTTDTTDTAASQKQPSANAHTARRSAKRPRRKLTSHTTDLPDKYARSRRARKPRVSDELRYSATGSKLTTSDRLFEEDEIGDS